MTLASSPVEHRGWHPVALAATVADAPLAALLLGEPLVLWREAGGVVKAWGDRCPHRGARLSLGCVRHDGPVAQLECPYHGWRFDGAGQVVVVPAQPGFIPPASHRAVVYDAVERYGLVWVRLAAASMGEPPAFAASMAEPPAFAAECDPRLRKLNCGPYDVATSAPRIVENFLDMAHFGFVHDGWLGDRGHTAVADYRIDTTATGFIASGCRAWQPKSSVQAQGGAEVEYTYEVNAPYTAVLTKLPLRAPEIAPKAAAMRRPPPPRGRRNTWGGPAFVSHEHPRSLAAPGVRKETTTFSYEGCVC